jgi:dTDP-glucose 4,6-dehydratase
LKKDFDCVVHLAAYNVTHVGARDQDLYQRVNVDGTRNLLRALRARDFIFLSTSKVYKNDGSELTEDSLLAPQDDYARSKLLAEDVCRTCFQGERLTIFRSVNIIGPGQPVKALIPVLFRKALAGEPLEIFVPKDLLLQLLYVDDAVKAIEAVLTRGGLSGVFNLSPDEVVRTDQLSSKVKDICSSVSAIVFTNEGKAVFSRVSCARVQDQLGWKAAVRVEDALKRCWSYYGTKKN